MRKKRYTGYLPLFQFLVRDVDEFTAMVALAAKGSIDASIPIGSVVRKMVYRHSATPTTIEKFHLLRFWEVLWFVKASFYVPKP